MRIDFTEMTSAEIRKLIADAEKALKKQDAKRIAEAKKAAEKAAKEYGLSLNELVAAAPAEKPAKRGRKPAKPKTKGVALYANPADPKQTWTGKGRRPAWILEGLAAGKTLDDFKI